jgi:trimethylamine corrinoid protein
MAQSIMDGDADVAEKLALEALEAGIDPLDAINQGFILGLDKVGELFSAGEAYLPELVMAGEAMKAAVNALEPEMARRGKGREILGKVVLGTIEGDIHDIGKSLVGTMLSVAGFKVFDLGVDVPVLTLIEKAREESADIIGVSALLTTTMVKQRVG